ncbi:MAG: allantoinase [Meiothermus sp.]|uniref:allantoinase n=1 Tax=Meiothermus sp. TaxID=1955249 RepID=UPI0025D24EAF|nr:allantoinase [Meiothermus sp.]MCS7059255.1 allantoinase [Meiothermus sp.]MCS7193850.1 allantoinase [Meiothermus sp.]MCX7739551.1 allantoinase [Meiothermus sp.]MDW8090310.1 allantoinase [Meiothermus sp.]MDW8481271.1 allantoinase [Meiothermus sp.]
MLDLIVRGGTLVTPEGLQRADLGVEGGQVAVIAPEIAEPARREVSAQGLYVFPGLIDVHVHFNEPGQAHWEGIATGSAALAAGGGTAFFDMPLNSLPCTLDGPSFDLKLSAMRAQSHTDFALWGGLTPKNLERLPELAERGVIGFKAFMCNSGLPEFPACDDATLYEGMRTAAQLGLPVAVHAESEALTAHLTQKARALGTSWREYLASRPVFTELEAIGRALLLAQETGCKLHIVHISSGSGVALAAEARAKGVDVSLETCPHYLAFTEDDLERLGAVGKCAPPLRARAEQEGLWSHVLKGSVDIIGSDHSPSPPEMKRGEDFFALWGGIAGVQSTLAVLLTEGWQGRGLPLERLAALLAQGPAQRFGLTRKGRLEPGCDADFTLVNLEREHTLTSQDLRYRHAISPYLNRTFRGIVESTWLRGEPIYAEGKIRKPSSVCLLTREA